ncbi:hypothetical protein [Pseudomonas azerbaijanorientalis]|uniref:hypothetical protein n=1 Tax=Pseudomonas azerbaijanorientalis TaxID=2842350 RepID=UPI001C3D24B1|nr:hypothetical protein [Pseudomonas azerbaijanorientalis]QXH63828.1 hypothetical protein KSS91_10225 [Pseudomonas azerbaijanorientalis]
MTFSYRGFVDVVLVGADGSNHVERFPAILNETLPGLFEMSTPYRLPAARGSHTICITVDDGQTLSGDVGYVGDYGLTFSRPRGEG